MNEATPGALLGVGKEAEVRAYGYLVAKLYNAGASKHRPLREAAIQAFAETLGPPVPSVHEVRQIDGRWAVVMDRVAGVSFAEAVRRDAQTLPRYLERMVALHVSVHHHEAIPLGGCGSAWLPTYRPRPGWPRVIAIGC